MSFQEFYTLGGKVHESTLSEIPENLYNTHDRKSAQEEAARTSQCKGKPGNRCSAYPRFLGN